MARIAFVFSGQGAQKPGMGKELYENAPASAEMFDTFEKLRPGTLRQCFEGPADQLNLTENTQPCLYAMEMGAAAALVAQGVNCEAVAGFSLGELSALAFSGAVDPAKGFLMVMKRAQLMALDSLENPGSMAAILKLPSERVEEICSSLQEAWPVNYNCPGQTVVACAKGTLAELISAVRASGGKALPLSVSGAFHSPFMRKASKDYGTYLSTIAFGKPRMPLYSNYTARPYAGNFAELLEKQICSPVRWQSIVENLITSGIDTFVEIGPGKTLCGLVSKINRGVRTFHVEDSASLEEAIRGCAVC